MAAPAPEIEIERQRVLRSLKVLDPQPDEALNDLCLLAARLCEAPFAAISFIQENRHWHKAAIGWTAGDLPQNIALYSHTSQQSDLLIVNDAARDSRFSADPMVTGDPGIHFYAGAPLIVSEGFPVGCLCVMDRKARTLTPEQQQSLQIVRDQVIRLLDSRRREAELTRSIATTESIQRALHETEQRFFQFLDALPIGVFVIDPDSNPHYANQAAQELLGRGIVPGARAEDLADTYQAYMAGTKNPYPAALMPVVRALAGERCMVTDMEIHRQNRIIPVQVWGAPIHDHNGRIAYAIAAFADTSERKRSEQLLKAINAVTRVMAASSDLKESAIGIAKVICESMDWDLALLWEVDSSGEVLSCVDAWSSPSVACSEFIALSRQLRFPRDIGIPGRVWAAREPVWIKDVAEDPNFPRIPAALRNQIHGAFGFPIMRENQLVMVFEFFCKDIREPEESWLVASKAIANQIEEFQFRKWIEQELTRMGWPGAR